MATERKVPSRGHNFYYRKRRHLFYIESLCLFYTKYDMITSLGKLFIQCIQIYTLVSMSITSLITNHTQIGHFYITHPLCRKRKGTYVLSSVIWLHFSPCAQYRWIEFSKFHQQEMVSHHTTNQK